MCLSVRAPWTGPGPCATWSEKRGVRPQPGNNTVNIRVEQHGAQPGSSVPSSSQQPAGAPLDKRTLEDCKMTVVRDGQFYAKSLGNSLA